MVRSGWALPRLEERGLVCGTAVGINAHPAKPGTCLGSGVLEMAIVPVGHIPVGKAAGNWNYSAAYAGLCGISCATPVSAHAPASLLNAMSGWQKASSVGCLRLVVNAATERSTPYCMPYWPNAHASKHTSTQDGNLETWAKCFSRVTVRCWRRTPKIYKFIQVPKVTYVSKIDDTKTQELLEKSIGASRVRP